VVLLETGSRPRGGVSKYSTGVPSVGAEHLTAGGRFDFSKVKYVPERFYASMGRGRIRAGDILLVKDGATIGKVSLVTPAFPFERACANEHVFILRPKSPGLLRPGYLFYFLSTPGAQARIRQRISGSAQGGLTQRSLSSLAIAVPHPREQGRIASILSNVDALMGNVEELSARHAAMKRALGQSIFGITFRSLKWTTKQLSEVVTAKPQYGVSDSAMQYDPALARYIRITDIREDGNLDDGIKVSTKLDGNERYLLRQNDLLFARTGSVGRTFLVKQKLEKTVFASYLIRFNIDPSKAVPAYLEQYTRSDAYWSWVDSRATQSVQPNINAKQFSKLQIPVPPMPEQRRIASILSGVDAVIENYRLYQQQLEMLKKGLMQKLLTGKIRV